MDNKELKELYYNGYARGREIDRLFGSKADNAEFIITNKYIGRYLHEGARVIDIGAGAGAYSRHLTAQGYAVDALDLHPLHVEQLTEALKDYDSARAFQADAADLSAFPDNSYDLVLLLGPIYHLPDTEQRLAAISEALRVAKKGAPVFTAFCLQDAPLIEYIFQGEDPALFLRSIGYDRDTATVTENTGSAIIIDTIASVNELTEKACASLPAVKGIRFAQDGLSHIIRDAVNTMNDESYAEWIQYLTATAEREELIGYSNHIVQILIKQ